MADLSLADAVARARADVLADAAKAGIHPGGRLRGRVSQKRAKLAGEAMGAAGVTGAVEILLTRLAPYGWSYERLADAARAGDGYLIADRHRRPLSFVLRNRQ